MIGLVGLFLADCRRELMAPRAGELRFSRDTVRFDSLFSTVLSPTQRLWIYNPHSHPVRLLRVRLEGGERSPYSFILDGQEGPLVTNYLIAARDSAQVFIRLRDTTFVDAERFDKLLFETETGVQEVVLQAILLSAYVYQDFGFDSAIVSLPSDKPIVIDGFLYVGPNAQLRILPGTRLYFSGRRWESGPLQGELKSGIYVAGTLEVLGMPEAPVKMQGWRLEPYYASAPGQWQGIWFFPSSRRNRLLSTEIFQSSIGVRIDSAGDAAAPKVFMDGCIITDAANYGLVAQGFCPTLPPQPILHAVNTLIYRCGQACMALVGGGLHRLVHCTLLYDQGDVRRGITSLVLTDFLRLPDQVQTYPIDFLALNSVIWSTKEDAVAADLRGSNPQQVYDHCALRQRESLPGSGNIYPSALGLGAAADRYPLLENSPLINAGRYDALWSPSKDLRGRNRDAQPDIGVYEYVR
ncbi:MAG: choice-of-anchor Q domain-containing protein [Bacteroidia bacterium]